MSDTCRRDQSGETVEAVPKSEDTTRFSGVEFQLRPTTNVRKKDTTRFSGVESQLQPTTLAA